MNPSYARIRVPLAEALRRFALWIDLPELEPPRSVSARNAVNSACENGIWRSKVAVFIYEANDWTVIENMTGYLGLISAARWQAFAGDDDLVFAGYNDSVPYGQLIVINGGRIVREFLDDQQDPSRNVNRGRLAFENHSPINDWTGAESFVDGDDIASLGSADTGLLWMFG